jgi:conjugative transposon protein TcpC
VSTRAAVDITARPVWLITLGTRCLRLLLLLAAVVGIAVTARNAIAPARPIVSYGPRPEVPDTGEEAYASLFARRYLTWNANDTAGYQQGLAPFGGSSLAAGAGVTLPSSGAQQVQWTQPVQWRDDGAGGHLYTLAVQTDTTGLLYLTVPVRRDGAGRVVLDGYPGFVGAPASGGFVDWQAGLRDVADASLQQVASRALRNYLAGADANLSADLTSDARVSLPALALSLGRITRLSWSRDGRSVGAELTATDTRGTSYSLSYELDVRRAGARWEISAIQMDPNV